MDIEGFNGDMGVAVHERFTLGLAPGYFLNLGANLNYTGSK